MKQWHGRRGLVTRPGTVSLVLLLALGAGAAVAGCTSEQVESSDTGQVGSLGVKLEVAPGVTLKAVTSNLAEPVKLVSSSTDVAVSVIV